MEARIRNEPDKTIWIACHWPLKDTVLGDAQPLYTSHMQSFYAKPDDRIRALLAKYPNARAWISGHTHSPIDAPGLLTRAKLPRGRKIVTVNCSAIVGVGKKRDAIRPHPLALPDPLPGADGGALPRPRRAQVEARGRPPGHPHRV